MQFKAVAVLALSGAALAAVDVEERQAPVPTDSIGASVLSVLATAIPISVQVQALSNSASFASAVASSIAAGNPPEWYVGLPDDVKSYLPVLYPAAAPATTTEDLSTPSSAPSVGTTGSVALNTTAVSTVSSATLGSSGGANSATGAPSSSLSSGGAAYPTAVVGAGVAGALGFLGMLAL